MVKHEFPKTILFIHFLWAFAVLPASAQNGNASVFFSPQNKKIRRFVKKHELATIQFKDSANFTEKLHQIVEKLHAESFFDAQIDSISCDSSKRNVYVACGLPYTFSVKKHNLDKKLTKKLNYRRKIENKELSFQKIKELQANIIDYYSNNGFPFSSVSLNNLNYETRCIFCNLDCRKKEKIVFNSLVLKGNSQISPQFIQNFVGIKPKMLFSNQKISLIEKKITNLDFLELIKPAELEFSGNKADVYLYLKKRKVNRLDGIIGFESSEKNGQKAEFSGEVKFLLKNTLKRGESFQIHWKKMKSASQRFASDVNIPFLFSLPIGLDLKIDITKKDSSWLKTRTHAGVLLYYSSLNHVKAFVEKESSSLVGKKEFSSLVGYQSTIYGQEFYFSNVVFPQNPRKGIFLKAGIGAGTKKKEEEKNKTLIEASLVFESYFNIFGDFVLQLKNRSAMLYSNSKFFENEFLQFGGLKNMRGFDEESLLANRYTVFTTEFRYLPEESSFLFVFSDFCLYEFDGISSYIKDTPFSAGFGLSFSTNAGIFNLTYAIGKQQNNPISVKNAKIHFGFITRF
ncbi:MAG: hypothetical protein CSA05_00075 [Bacteroidia bacterium]|nr:MAG: hypothetical protein CSB01_00950 [Bacteroidia bacterium]PIE86524.1 MAG: hypothetical protein CSA05_00075 [Bacteroidia bacterium]